MQQVCGSAGLGIEAGGSAIKTELTTPAPRSRGVAVFRENRTAVRAGSADVGELSRPRLETADFPRPERHASEAAPRACARLVENARGERCCALPIRRWGAVRGNRAADLHRRAVGVRRRAGPARVWGAVASRSVIRAEIDAMLAEAGAGEGIRRQVVYGATSAPTDPRGSGRRAAGGADAVD